MRGDPGPQGPPASPLPERERAEPQLDFSYSISLVLRQRLGVDHSALGTADETGQVLGLVVDRHGGYLGAGDVAGAVEGGAVVAHDAVGLGPGDVLLGPGGVVRGGAEDLVGVDGLIIALGLGEVRQ